MNVNVYMNVNANMNVNVNVNVNAPTERWQQSAVGARLLVAQLRAQLRCTSRPLVRHPEARLLLAAVALPAASIN